MPRSGAVGLQALFYDPKEDAQHHAQYCGGALHEVAQPLGHRQHPLAHWQAGKHGTTQVRRVVRASVGHRAKESLLVDFINQADLNQMGDKASVIAAFFTFAQAEQQREAQALDGVAGAWTLRLRAG